MTARVEGGVCVKHTADSPTSAPPPCILGVVTNSGSPATRRTLCQRASRICKSGFRHVRVPTRRNSVTLSHVAERNDSNSVGFPLWQYISGLFCSFVSHGLVNHSRQGLLQASVCCLNYGAKKSYFHYNGSIPLRGQEVG